MPIADMLLNFARAFVDTPQSTEAAKVLNDLKDDGSWIYQHPDYLLKVWRYRNHFTHEQRKKLLEIMKAWAANLHEIANEKYEHFEENAGKTAKLAKELADETGAGSLSVLSGNTSYVASIVAEIMYISLLMKNMLKLAGHVSYGIEADAELNVVCKYTSLVKEIANSAYGKLEKLLAMEAFGEAAYVWNGGFMKVTEGNRDLTIKEYAERTYETMFSELIERLPMIIPPDGMSNEFYRAIR